MKLIIPILFTLAAIAFFVFALHISQYKKRKSGCCGGADIIADSTGKTCDEDDAKSCICK